MKKNLLLSAFAALAAAFSASAYDFEVGGIYYNASGTEAYVTSGDSKYSGDIVIPSSVTNEDVDYTVTKVDESAFLSCDDLTSVVVPESVTSIGSYAFYNCYNLTSLTLPDTLTSIGEFAFQGTPLASKYEDGLCYIGSYLVGSLDRVYEKAIVKEGTIGIAPSVLAFRTVYAVELPSSLKFIGAIAFKRTDLTSLVIPEKVTTIEKQAFGNISTLTSITIPASVTSIGNWAFEECTALESVTVGNTDPANIKLGWPIFLNVPTVASGECVLRVPKGSKALYAAAAQWSDFANIEEYGSAIPGDANGDGKLSIADAVITVSYILGNNPAGFDAEAADLSGDSNITIVDVVAIVSLIL